MTPFLGWFTKMTDDKAIVSVSDLVPKHPAPYFNLAIEPWIPVLRDGEVQFVGFSALFEDAHQIDDLAVADPIEYFALTRYLIAVTYLIDFYAGLDGEGLDKIADGESFPPKAVHSVVDRLSSLWWLFHPDTPFFQEGSLPSKMSKKLTEKDTLETATVSYETLVPFRPAKTNEAWWYRADGLGLSFSEAALVLLSRHFAAVPGNEAGVLGKDKTRCEGGLMMSGPAEVTSLFWKGASLAKTLTMNLMVDISKNINNDDVLFSEAPLDIAHHIGSPLYKFSSSGGSAFLVWPGEGNRVQRVLRAPLPVPETDAKALVISAKINDPHVLRIKPKDGDSNEGNPNKGILSFSGSASQFENIYGLYRKSATGRDGLRDSIIKERATKYPLRLKEYSLCGTTIEGGGTFTGARINSVTSVTLTPQPLLLNEARSRVFNQLVGKFAGSSSSCISYLSHSIATALGLPKESSLKDALRSRARTHLWGVLEDSISNLYQLILDSKDLKELSNIPEETKSIWIKETMAVFDSTVASYMHTGSIQSRVFKSRSALERSLWKTL